MKRRDFLKTSCRCAALFGIGGTGVALGMKRRASKNGDVWQIDPNKCTACGQCATTCVLNISAAKCFHNFALCGYCELCTGYFLPEADLSSLHTGADMQLCPTGAITRTHVEGPSFEYNVDQNLCVGCGLCVEGCTSFGNGSLYLQIDQDVCLQCNQCAIAKDCPAEAITRVSDAAPYIFKK